MNFSVITFTKISLWNSSKKINILVILNRCSEQPLVSKTSFDIWNVVEGTLSLRLIFAEKKNQETKAFLLSSV